MSDTYGTLHAGDVVQGADGQSWGVEAVAPLSPAGVQVSVTLVRNGRRVRGLPPAAMPVVVLHRSDVSAEYAAASVLLAAGLDVDLVSEIWQS